MRRSIGARRPVCPIYHVSAPIGRAKPRAPTAVVLADASRRHRVHDFREPIIRQVRVDFRRRHPPMMQRLLYEPQIPTVRVQPRSERMPQPMHRDALRDARAVQPAPKPVLDLPHRQPSAAARPKHRSVRYADEMVAQ